MIFALIWRNLWRNRRRSLITMASVTFAVLLAVTMKSLQKGVFDNLVKNVVSYYSGYIQVHQNGYFEEQILDNSFEYPDTLIRLLKSSGYAIGPVPRLESFALASSGDATHGCMVVGTDPVEENVLTGLQSKVVQGNYFSRKDSSIIIAQGLAGILDVTVNDSVVLLGQGYHGSTAAAKYRVGALVRFASPQLNASLAFLPLDAAQTYLGMPGRITTLALNIERPEEVDIIKSRIAGLAGKQYEVLSWKDMMPEIEGHIRADSIDFYIFIGVLYLLIAFGIFGTVLMMLSERRYELGMLMAIGMKKMQLAGMLVGEIILLSVLGTGVGLAVSYPIIKYLEVNPIEFSGALAEAYKNYGFEPLWPAALDAGIFATQALIVLCISLVIGLFPVTRISRMDVVASMKK